MKKNFNLLIINNLSHLLLKDNMTASSVTGVGRGSAEGKSRGSSSQSLSVHKLVGPRVVAAGVVRDVVGTTFRVFLPPIPEGLPNYEPVDDEPGEEGDSEIGRAHV